MQMPCLLSSFTCTLHTGFSLCDLVSDIVVMLSTLFPLPPPPTTTPPPPPPPQTPLSQWTTSVLSWKRWSQNRDNEYWRMLLQSLMSLVGLRGNSTMTWRERQHMLMCTSTVTHLLHGKSLPRNYTIINRSLQLKK